MTKMQKVDVGPNQKKQLESKKKVSEVSFDKYGIMFGLSDHDQKS